MMNMKIAASILVVAFFASLSAERPESDGSGVVEKCTERIYPGPCHSFIPTYGFSISKQKCIPFIYGGCNGNANQFSSEEECNAVCESVMDISTTTSTPSPTRSTPSKSAVCNLPITPGPCEAYMPSFGYDSDSGKCIQFVYGGCLGNENRFGTENSCKQACGVDNSVTDAPNHGACHLPIVPGPCRMYVPSFGYDSDSGKCIPFVYGGCQGNTNKFGTLKECEQRCSV